MIAGLGELRRLGASLLALGRIRLELLSVEVQEEKQRVAALLFWSVLGALALGFALVFVALWLTVALWESHRLWALGVSAIALAALAGVAVLRLRSLASRDSTLFRSSIDELRADAAALASRAERSG